MIAGPLIGGAVAQSTTWRWLFYINFPFCAAGLISAPWMVRVHHVPTLQRGLRAIVHDIDWVGFGLFVAGSTSFLIGITWGGHEFDWDAYQTLLPLLLGLAGLCITVLMGVQVRQRSLYPPRHDAQSVSLNSILVYNSPGSAPLCPYLLSRAVLDRHEGTIALVSRSITAPIFAGLVVSSRVDRLRSDTFWGLKWAVWSGWAINTLEFGYPHPF